MRKICLIMMIFFTLFISGCNISPQYCDVLATTLPVFEFTSSICKDTPISVGRLITENVSCLHDYTLQVSQMKMIENADIVVISGAGLEDFMDDAFSNSQLVIDASTNAHIHSDAHSHETHMSSHGHHHEQDPHLWLSPENAVLMATTICEGLKDVYPEYADTFQTNLTQLLSQLDELQNYGKQQLADLSCRKLITFHDGFNYFAESFDLEILKAVEEESGSEASAAELIQLIELVDLHDLPAVFTELSGSDAAAGIISTETGVKVYTLDMAMAGDSYFQSMYHNIDTIKEALS